MRKHRGIPSRCDKCATLAENSPPGAAPGCFVGGHQPGLVGCKSSRLFKRGSSCLLQRQRQREPWGISPRPSAPTYLPTDLRDLPLDGRAQVFFVFVAVYRSIVYI